jgi:Zn-dependent protease
MLPTQSGSFRIFNLFGIDVFLHWSWFVVAVWRFQNLRAAGGYELPVYYAFEILALFAIVLMHEFGHSLACRQVGGLANQIVLWPLGGVAYVQPPERPGAQLWSIAAGPLVNVALLPLLFAYFVAAGLPIFSSYGPDSVNLMRAIFMINLGLLIFNILPVYPLDGGQILRSVLWFFLGRGKSLLVASAIGFVGVFALALFALNMGSIWMGILTFFVFTNCLRGWKQARAMLAVEQAPRHEAFECPACHATPPAGDFWVCQKCGNPFDMFANAAVCPRCQAHFAEVQCGNCGQWAGVDAWRVFGRTVRMR